MVEEINMEKNSMMLKIGTYAFIIGIIVALLIGVVHASTLEAYENAESSEEIENASKEIFFMTDNGGLAAWALAVIGAIIGVLAVFGKGTITAKETPGFLLAGIGLLIMGSVFGWIQGTYHMTPWIGSLLVGISVSLSIFVAPAVGILAIKAIWDMGKDV